MARVAEPENPLVVDRDREGRQQGRARETDGRPGSTEGEDGSGEEQHAGDEERDVDPGGEPVNGQKIDAPYEQVDRSLEAESDGG